MHRICRIVFFALACLAVSLTANAKTPVPKELLQEIDEHGAKATIARLVATQEEKDWDYVVEKIRRGKDEWLQVAAELASGSDAGTSSDLKIALAYALPRNPAGVLSIADSQVFLSTSSLCGLPFIEAERSFIRKYVKKTKRALTQMKNADLEDKRQSCLNQLITVEQRSAPSQAQKP